MANNHFPDIVFSTSEPLPSPRSKVRLDGKVLQSILRFDIVFSFGRTSDNTNELPIASKISSELIALGYDIPFALTDEELAEGICKLKSKI